MNPSVIKPGIGAIEQGRILKTLGRLKEADQQALKQAISTIIG